MNSLGLCSATDRPPPAATPTPTCHLAQPRPGPGLPQLPPRALAPMLGEIQDTCSDTETLQPPLGGHGGPSHSEGQRGQSGPSFSSWGPMRPEVGREELGLSTHPREGGGAVQGQRPYNKDPTNSQQKVTGGPRLREQWYRGALTGPVRIPERSIRKRHMAGGDCGQDRTLTTSIHL